MQTVTKRVPTFQLLREHSASQQPLHPCSVLISRDQDPNHLKIKSSTLSSLWDCTTCKCSTSKAEIQHSQSRLARAAAPCINSSTEWWAGPKAEPHNCATAPWGQTGLSKTILHWGMAVSLSQSENHFLKKRKPAWQVTQKAAKWPEALEYKQLQHSQQWEDSLRKMLYKQTTALCQWQCTNSVTDWGMCCMQPQQDQTDSEMLGWSCMCTIPTTRKNMP